MLKQIMYGMVCASVLSVAGGATALAHVTVKPAEVETGSYQVFTVSVPNEREQSTVEVRVDIPSGVTNVTPTAKQGWSIDIVQDDDSAVATTTSITWKDGEIRDGFRDEFTFSARTPDEAGDLEWKAYQTYADGVVVSWDEAESEGAHSDEATSGPFSVTAVTSDSPRTQDIAESRGADRGGSQVGEWALYVAISSLVVSMIAVVVSMKRAK